METRRLSFATPSCPHVGLKDDPKTCYAYPSEGNHCLRCRPPAIPLLEHQGAYCLGADYAACPAFQGTGGQRFPLPHKLRGRARWRPMPKLFAFALGLALLAFAGWRVFPGFGLSLAPAPVSGPQAVIPLTAASATATPSDSLRASPSPERPSPSPVPPSRTPARPAVTAASPTAQQAHALEVPIRVDGRQFLIHRVLGGESFESLERTFETSAEVIVGLNPSVSSPLWANSLVVLSPGTRELDPDLPAFQPYQVTAPAPSLAGLAAELQVDLSLLAYYNNCPETCQFEIGDWLLVPRPK